MSRTIKGYELVCTCGACPEQYDVYRDGHKVAYLRLRHGWFYAEAPYDGEIVYEASPDGDGIFADYERDRFLEEAIAAVDRTLSTPPSTNTEG